MNAIARVMEDVFVTPHSLDSLEDRIAESLRGQIGESRFDQWFDRKTRFSVDGNALIVEAANAFSANWIRNKFGDALRTTVQRLIDRPIEICVRVGEATTTAPSTTGDLRRQPRRQHLNDPQRRQPHNTP